ncbi:hypothetical protein [Lachnoclostridium sp. Marseille-P6806]|uniref:hypothetical protein n=1 Tax=Lachnoclostridium sp. Marseille-P6806 TaxID=2364793 RepID=UPI001F5F6A56|nr:hypothetical protein [Lachnoclostridium sp. Marseille-P6806]
MSIVENPKPSRGHYGTWLGEEKQPSYQERLRRIIDAVLEEKPKDFSDFLKKLEESSVEVNTERKNLRLKLPGQDRYTRCNILKGDYTEQAIRAGNFAGTGHAAASQNSQTCTSLHCLPLSNAD